MTDEEIKKLVLNLKLQKFKLLLKRKIKKSEQVFIVTHKRPDFDAIASALGLALIAKKFKKNVHIIIDDNKQDINQEDVSKIIKNIKTKINIITSKTYEELKSNNDLLIITDTNKTYQVCCEDYLSNFKTKIIIDHHQEDKFTIKTPYKFIDLNTSSACETVTDLLDKFNINYGKKTASYLLAGIYLDTNQTKKGICEHTASMIGKLISKEADQAYVNSLFQEDIETDKRISHLVHRVSFHKVEFAVYYGSRKIPYKEEDLKNLSTYKFAISCGEENIEYSQKEIAIAADRLAYNYKNAPDASFVIGKINDNKVIISARGNGLINTAEIMEQLEGGGNTKSAATKLNNITINEAEKRLIKIIKPNFYTQKED